MMHLLRGADQVYILQANSASLICQCLMVFSVGLKKRLTVQVPDVVLPFWSDCCSVAVVGVVLIVEMKVVHVVVLQVVTQVASLILRHMWCSQQPGS